MYLEIIILREVRQTQKDLVSVPASLSGQRSG